jgi:hypothetical protein
MVYKRSEKEEGPYFKADKGRMTSNKLYYYRFSKFLTKSYRGTGIIYINKYYGGL